ncbi:hypothetical protein [Tahibacter amnicola]|uniref:Uncharacterized protein n=1 Tax=Tahibacter amnicola TaxID=2976241 RepID=A0ABY6BED3_9GAMM|nr:hypothetical protein [Tahibacter amnicola]UXI68389.1 hypothetical protein N4264_01680 [Tahibacter amnicola]
MSAALLLILSCLALAAFACAAVWSSAVPGHARRWDAAFALALGFAALELVVLGSPLAMWFPVAAVIGAPFPLIAPVVWRRGRSLQPWSSARWARHLMPAGVVVLVLAVIHALAGLDAIWPHAAPVLVLVSAVAGVAHAIPRRQRQAEWTAFRPYPY